MRRTWWVVLVALALVPTACFGGRRPAPPPAAAAPRSVYVAVGASESVGIGADNPLTESWPQVLFRTAMPAGTVFYDVGSAAATVADALSEELPQALDLAPTVVTVWLNVDDLIALVPAAAYERELGTLIHALRRGGKTKVLLANAPPLDVLPSVTRIGLPKAAVDAAVTGYDEAVARVAAAEGATVVDLHAVGAAAVADGTYASLIGADGFHPSTAGHAAVARAFARALAAAPTPTTRPGA